MVFSFREIPDLKKKQPNSSGVYLMYARFIFLKIDLLIHAKAGQSDII